MKSAALLEIPKKIREVFESGAFPAQVWQIRRGRIHILLVSDAYLDLAGVLREEVSEILDESFFRSVHPRDRAVLRRGLAAAVYRESVESSFRFRIGGEWRTLTLRARRQITEEGREFYLALFEDRDGEGSRNFLTLAEEASYVDVITGLPNINYFRSFADGAAEDLRESGARPAYVFFDVTGMHSYNELRGYDAGNALLREVGIAIGEVFPEDLVCRYGEDHFGLLTGSEEIGEGIDRINSLIRSRLGDPAAGVKAGIYRSQGPEGRAMGEMEKARQAFRSIGLDRTSSWAVYDSGVREEARRRDYVLRHFHRALESGWIVPYYQPEVQTRTGRLAGAEALARWVDPERGVLPPSEFIPPLEEAHLIHLVDLEIIRRVCGHIRSALDRGRRADPISVNLSRIDFAVCDIFREVQKIRREFLVPADLLNIEITESALTSAPEALRRSLRSFREAGYQVWMDDFGSEYSSLNALQDFTFDRIKIDMNFLRNLETNPRSRIIVTAVVELAGRLGVATLCEGVETRDQLEFLREIGCETAQGYLFSRPLPARQMEELARQMEDMAGKMRNEYERNGGELLSPSDDYAYWKHVNSTHSNWLNVK